MMRDTNRRELNARSNGSTAGRSEKELGSDLLTASLTQPWHGGASFSFRNRLYRLSWSIAWKLLASWTPPYFRRWRRFLLALFGAQIAPTANVYGSARIWSPVNLLMAEYATIGPNTNIYNMAQTSIGSYAIISQGAHLCAGSHDVDDVFFQLTARPIVIGHRAWIAAEAFVGPGVAVGPGAVLGARACAMRDLDEWTVYSGNPAKKLRARHIRFDDKEPSQNKFD